MATVGSHLAVPVGQLDGVALDLARGAPPPGTGEVPSCSLLP